MNQPILLSFVSVLQYRYNIDWKSHREVWTSSEINTHKKNTKLKKLANLNCAPCSINLALLLGYIFVLFFLRPLDSYSSAWVMCVCVCINRVECLFACDARADCFLCSCWCVAMNTIQCYGRLKKKKKGTSALFGLTECVSRSVFWIFKMQQKNDASLFECLSVTHNRALIPLAPAHPHRILDYCINGVNDT